MFVQLTRFGFAILGALAGLSVRDLIGVNQQLGYSVPIVIILFVILGAAVGFILGGIIGRELERTFVFFESYLRHVSLGDLILGVAGLLVGLVIALIISNPLRVLQPQVLSVAAQVGLFMVLGYTGVRVALIKREDLSTAFLRTGTEKKGPAPAATKLLDTSAVIDGRFAELLKAGFIEGEARVPGFVLSELQTLADSADDLRRARGRRGLDLLATLGGGEHAVSVFSMDYPEVPDVDSKLVRLAKETASALVTVDFNLSQVARVQGVEVLNINDLAAALRPTHLPGETIRLHVTREGKESDQGVGYLEDGTMVVVQNGRSLLGEMADVVVTSVLQTAAGRMVFARPGTA
jgi:uncharacterized protein YacL